MRNGRFPEGSRPFLVGSCGIGSYGAQNPRYEAPQASCTLAAGPK